MIQNSLAKAETDQHYRILRPMNSFMTAESQFDMFSFYVRDHWSGERMGAALSFSFGGSNWSEQQIRAAPSFSFTGFDSICFTISSPPEGY